MVNVDGSFHIPILIDYLVFIWNAADTVGSFPSRSQFGGTLWWGVEGKDEASHLVGVSNGSGRWGGYLLVGELELLFNPKTPDGVYKPPLVYCRMGFINTSPFPALHLSRNASKVSESLNISDQRMAKLY